MKVCRICGKMKSESEFYKDKKAIDSLTKDCKECRKSIVIEYQKEKFKGHCIICGKEISGQGKYCKECKEKLKIFREEKQREKQRIKNLEYYHKKEEEEKKRIHRINYLWKRANPNKVQKYRESDKTIVTGKQIGRASCRERVSSPV